MNVNETIDIRSLVSGAPKHFKLTMASRQATFSGNTSLIATLLVDLVFVNVYFFFAGYRNTQSMLNCE